VKRTRESGSDLVVTVSAMGKQTDRLLRARGRGQPGPSPREIDQLLSPGELQSVALLAMALHDRGVAATSLTGRRPA
jgi:aspartate kinase